VSPLFVLLALALIAAQFALPRRLAFLPLLIAAAHFQIVPLIKAGAAFDTVKLVILAGLIRAMKERTFTWSSRQPLDVLVAAWAGWVLLSGFAHNPPDHNPITIRLSQIYGIAGSYLYARAFIRNPEDYLRYVKCLGVVILPLALLAVYERYAQQNLYGLLGSGASGVTIRSGRVRAAGPFAHPILLGTFGAASAVLLAALYHRDKRWSLIGAGACAVTVFSSASSGPIVTLFSGFMGLALWRWRTSVGRIRVLVILTFLALHMAMQAPVWYLMARIDLAGGSTGWHRAELITAAVNHIGEWWLTGTDYTRHWIAYGVPWSAYHTDITNYYIGMGVMGGLPCLLLFVGILFKAFQTLGRRMRTLRAEKSHLEFVLWTVGASLFAHCFTFLSIGYFDQSYVPLNMLLGSVVGLCAVSREVKTVPGTEAGATPISHIGSGRVPDSVA
jgi:hypothetical protein